MKNYSLVVALFILLVVSMSLADSIPVPEETEETVESDGAIEITVEPAPVKYYSPCLAGFGNIIPSLGYFLIDEPGWAWAELGLMGLAGTVGAIGVAMLPTTTRGYLLMISAFYLALGTELAGIVHAPLLADYKNNQQKVALDLSPGVGLDSTGEVYPTVQLTLSF